MDVVLTISRFSQKVPAAAEGKLTVPCVWLQVVEQTIMASGLLLLMGSGLLLVIRDITNLRG
jgi:hypothetical protein